MNLQQLKNQIPAYLEWLTSTHRTDTINNFIVFLERLDKHMPPMDIVNKKDEVK